MADRPTDGCEPAHCSIAIIVFTSRDDGFSVSDTLAAFDAPFITVTIDEVAAGSCHAEDIAGGVARSR